MLQFLWKLTLFITSVKWLVFGDVNACFSNPSEFCELETSCCRSLVKISNEAKKRERTEEKRESLRV